MLHLVGWQKQSMGIGKSWALALKPDYPEALSNRGNALRNLDRSHQALASRERALALNPDFAEALSGRGGAIAELMHPDEALASYDRNRAEFSAAAMSGGTN
jgi:tetratricopeptide (TPR) repeat protein